MKADHDFHYNKLYELIPEEHHIIITAANHFTNDKLNWIRKRILDGGNESLRNFTEEMENYSVSFIFKIKIEFNFSLLSENSFLLG